MEIKTLTDVIKFVNQYWNYYRLFRDARLLYNFEDTLTSTGDYE